MAMKSVAKAAGISAGTALLAGLSLPFLTNLSTPFLTFVGERLSPVPDYPFGILPFFSSTPIAPAPFVCDATHPYRTELVSLDPLVIYIHSLITPGEISALLRTAEPEFAPSEVTKNGRTLNTADRTSSSAGLPRDDPTVMCVLDRARNFLGTMLRDGWDEMGPPQLVRYRAGQKFNVHHDWYEAPRWAKDGSMRRWNRVASFFAILQDNCTGGETHFPYIRPSIVDQSPHGEPKWRGGLQDQIRRGEKEPRPLWREHENGGVAFRPVAGNAIFWVNLHPNGTGDERTNHAGLPLVDGLKTAMNIWPRQYYPYD